MPRPVREFDFAPVTADDASIRMPEHCQAENQLVRQLACQKMQGNGSHKR
jgi:hypothetical protein